MVLIIGASSFIGVHTVAEYLSHGVKVAVTGRNNKFKEHYDQFGVDYYNLDLATKDDFEQLPKEGVEGVILLAGLLPANAEVDLDKDENAADYFRINVMGTINVLEYCRKNSIGRVISACSYADVKNAWSKDKALTEEEPRSFSYKGDHAVYVISKNAANDVMEYYNQQHGMKNAWFRFPPVYGAGPHGSLFVNGKEYKSGLQIFMDNAAEGKDICVYGDSSISRDVVSVKDVARAYYQAMFSDKTYGLYNITSGRAVTLKEQAEVIAEVFRTESKNQSKVVLMPEKVNNSESYLFSIEKAHKDFGYEPQFADFKAMMADWKRDIDNNLYRELFHY
ncbi:MAG: NAD(P)-dependent oxidoreductase [Prevotella sp.]|nr:NAD(P)-dependent oxidoreductase [Prevotella sp.]